MALRVIIEVVDGDMRLVHQSRADMILPTTSDAGEVVAELRDENDQPIHRQNVSSLFDSDIEVFSPDRIQRVDRPDRKRTVTLVVPDEEGARSIVFVRRTLQRRGGLRMETHGVDELGRVTLQDKT